MYSAAPPAGVDIGNNMEVAAFVADAQFVALSPNACLT